MKISEKGLTLIKHFESLHDGDLSQMGLQPKMCPAGIWTVGYGRALKREDGSYLRGIEDKDEAYSMYPNLTEEEATIMLDEDCDIREIRLNSLNLSINQNQFDALISFIYNVGFFNFCIGTSGFGSTLYRYIKIGTCDPESIRWAFMIWNKARVNGVLKPLKGLTRRRKAEAELYLTGNLIF